MSLLQAVQVAFVLIVYILLVFLLMHASTLSLYVPSIRVWRYFLYMFLLPLSFSSIGLVFAIILYYFGPVQDLSILSSFYALPFVDILLRYLPLWVGVHGMMTLFIVLEVQRDRKKLFRSDTSDDQVQEDLDMDDYLSKDL